MGRRFLALVALLAVGCNPARGCIESNFELAPESRLPTWLQLPPGISRQDVSLSLYYYGPLIDSVDDTVFTVSVKGRNYQTLTGKHWWHPRTKKQLDLYYGTTKQAEVYYATGYVVIQVNGEVDVIEHREYREQNRDPNVALFWMADDSQIVREGRASKANAEALR